MASLYERIACLSTEAVEVMYALGAEDLVVGISGYSVHPPRARLEKPKVSGFSSAKPERIMAVEPDLVLTFSNMQSELCRQLVAEGVEVHAYNQYTIAGIFRMIRSVAALIDKRDAGEQLVQELEDHIAAIRLAAARWSRRPRVYFEEWDAPMISGISWVSELILIAGGVDVFADLGAQQQAKHRIIEDAEEVVRRAPDIIIGSWCGKKFRAETLAARDGWDQIPAVRNNMLFEIKSPDILSPGPAAIREGLSQLHRCIERWHEAQ
ncbi:cobalamin-binding protein [Undibacterium sp. LX40W]|uniref:Cobalamin-binding protein n=1 Tax=Undibacterium nitidum TaxID=2762298 RepID=A0A923KU06_9BURK|nr:MULTISPECIES: cobalamin-binding protein [Undibacterium]MBC3882179.1 cobalamin-binding protein [Undibacterium nitidum]MBC3892460.1 cobalamin-binding protein [Undibacterium sp. LX40W]